MVSLVGIGKGLAKAVTWGPKTAWNHKGKIAIGGAAIAGGAVALNGIRSVFDRPGISEGKEELQRLQDQVGETSAKLEALQSMMPQNIQPVAYPATMMVPANSNLTDPQYMGKMAAQGQGVQVGA